MAVFTTGSDGKVTTRLWLQVAAVVVVSVYAYVFMEWLFFATKPSFLSALSLWQGLRIIPLVSGPLLLAGLLFVFLCGLASLPSKLSTWRWLCLWAALLGPALILATLFYLLIDNFSYTVFGVGTLTLEGRQTLLPIALSAVLLILCWVWLARSTARWAESPGVGRVAKTGGVAAVLIPASFALAGVALLAFVTEMPGNLELAVPSAEGAERRRPNIILIGGDGLNAEHLGLYGYSRETTPRLGEFAGDALVFENAFSNSAHTGSSLMSIFTGKLPTTTSLIYPPDILKGEDAYQHWPGILQKLGYRNSIVSVRHYGDPYDQNLRDGFHFSNGRLAGPAPAVMAAWVGWSAAYFGEVLLDRIDSRVRRVMGHAELTDAYQEVTQLSDNINLRDVWRLEMFQDQIAALPEPFFAHLHLMGTHGPRFRPRERVFSRDAEQAQPWMTDFYDDAILDFDRYFGEVLEFLKERGLFDQSLIVVYSDHGLGFQSLERIPLLIRLPGGRAGRVSVNVQNADIAPTILDYLGLGIPDWIEGRSMLGPPPPPDRPIFSVRIGSRLMAADKTGRLALDPVKLEPPFYGLGRVGMVHCNQGFEFDLSSWSLTEKAIEGHTSPCNDRLDSVEAQQKILDHLARAGYFDDPEEVFPGRLLDGYSSDRLVRVLRWGPVELLRGQTGFNVQPDGSSALWLQVEGATQDLGIFLEDRPLATTAREGSLAATLQPRVVRELTRRPGKHQLSLVRDSDRKMQFVGFLLVEDDSSEIPAVAEGFDPEYFRDGSLRSLIDWGPRHTEQGRPFNVQPDGSSAFWIKAEGGSADISVFLESEELISAVASDFISARIVDPALLEDPGSYRLYLVSLSEGIQQLVGEFEIRPSWNVAPEELAEGRLVEVTGWGPRSTLQGEAFNPQPDGSSAFWIRTADPGPRNLTVLLDGRPLRTTLEVSMVTARLGEESLHLEPGIHELALADGFTRTKQRVGAFEVHPRLEVRPADLPDRAITEIVDWGPREVVAGRPFHPQPDGRSTFWMRVERLPGRVAVFLEDVQLDTVAADNLVSALVPQDLDLLRSPGTKSLYLVDSLGGGKQRVGRLEVHRNWWSWLW